MIVYNIKGRENIFAKLQKHEGKLIGSLRTHDSDAEDNID